MKILAIDPGPKYSAWVLYEFNFDHVGENGRVLAKSSEKGGVELNACVFDQIKSFSAENLHVVIEMVASYGMPVGEETFETCVVIGQFMQCALNAGCRVHRLKRHEVKMFLCHKTATSDSNIRRSLLDRFGPGEAIAIGKKGAEGPLYGIKGDAIQALALAVTFACTYLWSARSSQETLA